MKIVALLVLLVALGGVISVGLQPNKSPSSHTSAQGGVVVPRCGGGCPPYTCPEAGFPLCPRTSGGE